MKVKVKKFSQPKIAKKTRIKVKFVFLSIN